MAKKKKTKKSPDQLTPTTFAASLRAAEGFDLLALDPRSTPGFDGDKAAGEEALGRVAYEEAAAEGRGVITVDGKMIEHLHVANARRVLAIADAIAAIG